MLPFVVSELCVKVVSSVVTAKYFAAWEIRIRVRGPAPSALALTHPFSIPPTVVYW